MKQYVSKIVLNQVTFLWRMLYYFCVPATLPFVLYKMIMNTRYNYQKTALQDKVVLITGASSGLGEAIAHMFYSSGCRVVLASRRSNELNRVKEDLLRLHPTVPTHPPVVLEIDLSDLNSLPSSVDKIYEILGNVDILINNAGMSYRGAVLNTKVDVDIKVMLVNYFGQIALTKSVLPKMLSKGSGHIVFISSIQGRFALPYRSAYSASKHAVQAFADSLRAELSGKNINVTVISPGYIKTSLSLNAITENGEKYGVMDSTTASGYSPEYVAEEVLSAVVQKKDECFVSPVIPKIALFIRYLSPALYFRIMQKRAQKQT